MKIVINRSHGGFRLSSDAEKILTMIFGEDEFYGLELHENRNNPIFVALVEKMGKGINGDSANLKVVEIPDGLSYEINEYDGYESVNEYISVTEEELRNGISEEKLGLLKHTREIRVK